MSLPLVAMALRSVPLSFGAIDLADFCGAKGYGAELILAVFVLVVDSKFIAGELKMVPSSSWKSLPVAITAFIWASLPFGAVDFADFSSHRALALSSSWMSLPLSLTWSLVPSSPSPQITLQEGSPQLWEQGCAYLASQLPSCLLLPICFGVVAIVDYTVDTMRCRKLEMDDFSNRLLSSKCVAVIADVMAKTPLRSVMESANIMGMPVKHWWVMIPATVDSADFMIAQGCGTEYILDAFVLHVKVTLLNFAITPEGSQAQMLGIVAEKEHEREVKKQPKDIEVDSFRSSSAEGDILASMHGAHRYLGASKVDFRCQHMDMEEASAYAEDHCTVSPA